MKKTQLIILLLLPITIFGQSKFNVEAHGSSLLIKSDAGLAYGAGIGYQASSRINLVLGYLNGTIDSDFIDDDYSINKYYFNVDYRFNKENSKFGIASIMGFSYMDFDEKLNLNDGNGFGMDLGANTFITQNENFEYGFKLISTFNSESPGAILETGLYVKYKF
ncbi:hypothetical protein [Winogradskyella flava]|uniref:hypothetical protein n=1 Tax=Winogradskyella flava TaxID=1884876 RepID=UPI00248FE6CC|nr:hypothetical protein [Winogradskyella flava]